MDRIARRVCGQSGHVLVTACLHPLDESRRESDLVPWEPGLTLRDCLPAELAGLNLAELAVSVGGTELATEEADAYLVGPGDAVCFKVLPLGGGGGGGGGKDAGRSVAMLAVVAAAVVTAGAAGGLFAPLASAYGWSTAAAITPWIQAAAGAGVMVGGSMLVNAAMPTPRPGANSPALSFSGGNGFQDSPTYAWSLEENPTHNGRPVPVPFGEVCNVTPFLLARFTSTDGEKQLLNLLFILGEGELDEQDGVFDVKVNSNPIANYPDVQWGWTRGTAGQQPVSGFSETINEVPVNGKLAKGDDGWVYYETQGDGVRALGLCAAWHSGLGYLSGSGAWTEATVELEIQFRPSGGSDWSPFAARSGVKTFTVASVPPRFKVGGYLQLLPSYGPDAPYWTIQKISGQDITLDKAAGITVGSQLIYADTTGGTWNNYGDGICTATALEPEFRVTAAQGNALYRYWRMDGLAAGRWEVRARIKDAPDPSAADEVRYRLDTWLWYVQEIVPESYAHPHTALLWIKALATDRLSGLRPVVTCSLRRSTVSVWDGSAWVAKAANNPAWASLDLGLHRRYGAGLAPGRAIFADFSRWAEWCDLKKITCALYLDSAMDLETSWGHLGLLGRGQVVWRGVCLGAICDRPQDLPDQGFVACKGNTLSGSFGIEWGDLQDRADAVEISYRDKEKGMTTVLVPGPWYHALDRQPRVSRADLLACDNRDLAVRHGRYWMALNRWLTKTVSLSLSVDALGCNVGGVIQVASDQPEWGISGRLAGTGPVSAVLDRKVALEPGKTCQVLVSHLDQLHPQTGQELVEWISVLPVAELTETDTLWLAAPWQFEPGRGAKYSFGEAGRLVKWFRVMRITRSSRLRRVVEALEYAPEVYADEGVEPVLDAAPGPAAVSGLRVRELWEASPAGGQAVAELTWRGAALSWGVWYREIGAAWVQAGWCASPRLTVRGLAVGRKYEFAVSDRSPDAGLVVALTMLGKLAPPSDVAGFIAWQDGEEIKFAWDHVPDGDRDGYQIRMGAAYESGEPRVELVQQNRWSWKPPLSGTYIFWIKARDTSKIWSRAAVSAAVNFTALKPLNIVTETQEVDGARAALATGDFLYLPEGPVTGVPALCRLSALTCADLTGITFADLSGRTCAKSASGEHVCAPIEFGGVASVTLRAANVLASVLSHARLSDLAGSTCRSLAGHSLNSLPGDTISSLWVRTTQDGVAWGEWQRLTSAMDISVLGYQIKLSYGLRLVGTRLEITGLDHIADAPERTIRLRDQAVPAGGRTWQLADLGLAILVGYQVEVTVLGAAAFPEITKASDGFSVDCKSGETSVARTCDITITGA